MRACLRMSAIAPGYYQRKRENAEGAVALRSQAELAELMRCVVAFFQIRGFSSERDYYKPGRIRDRRFYRHVDYRDRNTALQAVPDGLVLYWALQGDEKFWNRVAELRTSAPAEALQAFVNERLDQLSEEDIRKRFEYSWENKPPPLRVGVQTALVASAHHPNAALRPGMIPGGFLERVCQEQAACFRLSVPERTQYLLESSFEGFIQSLRSLEPLNVRILPFNILGIGILRFMGERYGLDMSFCLLKDPHVQATLWVTIGDDSDEPGDFGYQCIARLPPVLRHLIDPTSLPRASDQALRSHYEGVWINDVLWQMMCRGRSLAPTFGAIQSAWEDVRVWLHPAAQLWEVHNMMDVVVTWIVNHFVSGEAGVTEGVLDAIAGYPELGKALNAHANTLLAPP